MSFPRVFPRPAVGLAGACALALLAAACTSDTPNEVGRDLVALDFDETLVMLPLNDLTQNASLEIVDEDVPLKNQQLVYLGSREGNRSSVLVNFDFATLDTTGIPPESLHPDSTKTIRFRLNRAQQYDQVLYAPSDPDSTPLMAKPPVYYMFHEMDAPFDSTGEYPGPEPTYNPYNFNDNYADDLGTRSDIAIDPGFFWSWYNAGGEKGFIIRSGPEADTTLVGFASRDMLLFGSQMPPFEVNETVTPHFTISLSNPDTTLILTSYADISTFHEVAAPPATAADGFMLRTCLRNYPAMHFDFSALPADVYINRAVLRLSNDTARGFGTWHSLVVSEYDSLMFDPPGGSLTLDELEDEVYEVIGIISVTPQFEKTLEFNVTQYVQRRVNNVYEGSRGLVVTPDEVFFPSYDVSTAEPDFYFSEYHFFGTAAHDTLRPQLQITYSRIDDLDGGAP